MIQVYLKAGKRKVGPGPPIRMGKHQHTLLDWVSSAAIMIHAGSWGPLTQLNSTYQNVDSGVYGFKGVS